ncbi:hypothetical protein BGZ83_009688 [Gryganskiella cystojenkinii]|nr:hypothetical protein BGZ83_009688 [Gryganskiella cystojenkinii]
MSASTYSPSSSSSPPPTFSSSVSPTSPSSPRRPLSQAAVRSRSPPLTPLPALSTTVPGLTPFDRAVHVVNTSNRTVADTHTLLTSSSGSSSSGSDVVVFAPEDQLLLYGAYKQATKGDVMGLKPPFFEIAARSKWQAWANMRGKTKTEAQDIYVDLVVNSLTKPGSHPDHVALAEEITQKPSRSSSPTFSTLNTNKDLPPIIHSEETSISSEQPPNSSSPSLRPTRTRQGSIAHSTRSTVTGGLRSAATSVYELASENLPDIETDDNQEAHRNSEARGDLGYHEITETVVEEEILDDDAYQAEVRKSFSSSGQDRHRAEHTEEVQSQETDQDHVQAKEQTSETDDEVEEDEDHDEVYQSSEEYDESELEERNISDPSFSQSPTVIPAPYRQQDLDVKEFVDEGVFEDEDEDEDEQDDIHGGEVHSIIFEGARKESARLASPVTVEDAKVIEPLSEKAVLASPTVQPYRVFALHDTSTPTSAPAALGSLVDEQDLSITSHVASASSPHASMEGLVCPVSKKTAASGQMCPAATFAQARAAQASAASSSLPSSAPQSNQDESSTKESYNAVCDQDDTHQPLARHLRSATEPASVSAPSSTRSSAVNVATSQGKRIGQGIVSRFSALKSSLAAASARAASSALSAGSGSGTGPMNPNAVVVKDPVTNQSVTVVCPHLVSTQLLETEVVRLQTDISVLHERLDLLQQSLKIKSQTQAQERRSARGILKLILRQGLINAVLLLIVFAVLYKRKSPIAYAILAYIGQGRREGEAGWRAFLRWSTDILRRGQRNQQYVLNAGRRNGYW